MRSLSRIECFTVGCNNEASVTINGDHVCTHCASKDLPSYLHKFLPVPGCNNDNTDLIKALRLAMHVADNERQLDEDQLKLLADHIAALEAAQTDYIPFS